MAIKLIIILTINFFSFFAYSQEICEPTNEDLKEILQLAFEPVLVNKDSIILRYNFKAICVEKVLDKNKVKLWTERKIFNRLYENFYSLEDIYFTNDFAKITYIQRSKNLIFKIYLYKENGIWHLVKKQYSWQGKIKGDDFLLLSIKKALIQKSEN